MSQVRPPRILQEFHLAIERVMEETGCERLVTTEKDLWRLPAALRARARAVRISLRVEDPGFMDDVIERIGRDD